MMSYFHWAADWQDTICSFTQGAVEEEGEKKERNNEKEKTQERRRERGRQT